MLTLKERIPAVAQVDAELALPYELREKSRQRATLTGGTRAGEEAALFLPRNTVLRGGDCLRGVDDQGVERIVRVLAAPETVRPGRSARRPSRRVSCPCCRRPRSGVAPIA